MLEEQQYPVRLTLEEVNLIIDQLTFGITPGTEDAPLWYGILAKLTLCRRELVNAIPPEKESHA